MPGMKRKASRASPYEPYSKLTKERTHSAVDPLKRMTTTRITPAVAKWPSLKRSTTKDAPTPEGSEDASPPGLRRAPTLTLVEYSSPSTSPSLVGKRTRSKMSSLVVGEVITAPSLPKSASVVEGYDVLTTLTRLSSGSSIGCTTSFWKAPSAICKVLSKPSSPSASLVAKSISRGGSIVLDVREKPSSTSSSRAKSVSSIGDPEAAVSLEKVASLVKALSKPSLTKEKSASIIAAAADEAAMEAEEAVEKAEAAAAETKEEGGDGAVTRDIPPPPGGLMERVISFDTTGSMYSCLNQVRRQIQDMVQRLQADIPGIRFAIFAHGDYSDKDNYIVQWIDFGASTPEICKFVREVKKTSGGDIPEAYELVLRRCQTVLSWTPGSQRSLIMIGDATPHEADYAQNTERIDWQTECLALKASGVRIYAVQALGMFDATTFYRRMAELTGGRHFKLSQFCDTFRTIMAICYRERGEDFLQAYELEVRGGKGGSHLGRDLEEVFGTLKSSSDTGLADSKLPVLPILTVKKTAKKRREASTKKTKNKRNGKGVRKTTAGASMVKAKTKDPKVTDTCDYAWNNPPKGSTKWPHLKIVRNGKVWSGNECKRTEPKPKAKFPSKKISKLSVKKAAKLVSKKAKVALKKAKPGVKKAKPVSKKTKEASTNAKAAAKKTKMAAKKAKAAAKKTKPAAKKKMPLPRIRREPQVTTTTKKTKPAVKVKDNTWKQT